MFLLDLLTRSDADVMLRSAGAVAQLGARLTGSQEVAGSIPASSTNPTFFEVLGSSSFSPYNDCLFSLDRPQIILCNFRQARLLKKRRPLLMKRLVLRGGLD